MNIYVGYDAREEIPYRACIDSIRAVNPQINISGIKKDLLEEVKIYDRSINFPEEKASTDFAFTRFLVPYLNQYKGIAVFVDCDFIFFRDPQQLEKYINKDLAVSVVQHDYTPNFEVKMDGQKQVSYPRKNWSSLMVFNCEHPSCRNLSPENINSKTGAWLHRFEWCKDEEIGTIPLTWNFLEGEYTKEDVAYLEDFKSNGFGAVHYTNGGPWFPEVYRTRPIDFWLSYLKYAAKYMEAKDVKDVLIHQLK